MGWIRSSDVEGSNDDSNNFMAFLTSIVSINSSCENVSEILSSDDEGYLCVFRVI